MIEDIIEAIEQKRCVLIVGPELCHFEGKTFDESIKDAYDKYYDSLPSSEKRKIDNKKIEFINFPFLMEELMIHNSVKAEIHIYAFVKWYFKQRTEWIDYYKLIAALPIPLIISLLPDDALQNTFEEIYGENSNAFTVSSYSRKNSKVPEITEAPTVEKPLIYKLVGDIDKGDANFTFTDWFGYFKNIFGKKPLPVEILNILNENPMIVFLGVRFEKWYIQMLIRLLVSDENGALINGERFSFSYFAENDIETLVWDRFALNAEIEAPADFLQKVYDNCEKQGLLKRIEKSTQQINATVFISYNHQNTAIAEKLKNDLENYGITVLIDLDNPIGFSIPKFIESEMDKCDLVLPLISKTFLTSAWVAQESLSTIWSKKKVLPCDVDNALFDSNFIEDAFDEVELRRQEVAKRIDNRRLKGYDTRDLTDIEDRILDLKNNLGKIIRFFQNINRASLFDDNYDKGLAEIIASIQKQIAHQK